jgi:hypothetical protein
MSTTERLETTMLWLSFLSFCVSFTLTVTAAYYGSIFMALMAVFSSTTGALLHGIYRKPTLSEDMNSSDERKKREAMREVVFLIMLIVATMFFYAALTDVFYDTFNNTEKIIVDVLPPLFTFAWLVVFLFELLKRPPETLSQSEEQELQARP